MHRGKTPVIEWFRTRNREGGEAERSISLIFDDLKQGTYVREVIKTLDVDELEKAIKIFGKAQDRGIIQPRRFGMTCGNKRDA